MYDLKVFFPGESFARARRKLDQASDVMDEIPRLLEAHQGCIRIEVYAGVQHLFSVDCEPKRG